MPLEYSTSQRWIDENGFMRCTARILACGVMDYAAKELGDNAPMGAQQDQPIPIYVPPESLADPDSVASLEGMPVTSVTHEWIEAEDMRPEVGSIAGAPRVNGAYLEADIVVRDPETIKMLQTGKLSDISAGYTASYDMQPGQYGGEAYQGKQQNIRYNHVAILPPGEGRGGREIRVLNTGKEVSKMVDYTLVQVAPDTQIRVANEDVKVLNAAMKDKDEDKKKTENATTEQMNAMISELETLNGERDKLMNELGEMKNRLDAAMDPQAMENRMEETMNARKEASEMMAENGAYNGDKEKAMNSLNNLYGSDIMVEAVNAVRTVNSAAALSDDEAKDESFVRGVYSTLKSVKMQNTDKPKKPFVPGADAANVQTMNSKPENADPLGYKGHAAYKGAK